MGRIKGTLIKGVGKDLLKNAAASFGTTFEENKKKLNELGFKGTKAERNKIAGYMTKRLKKQKEVEEMEATEKTPPVQEGAA